MERAISDREALTCPGETQVESRYEEPQGELEQAIAQLWRAVFKLDRIGRNDNFFELGGNSLLAMDLSELFTTRLSIQLSVLGVFQYPTIRELAEIVAAAD
jgi:acyl carrier protein